MKPELTQETMKAKQLSVAIAALLAAGGLWLARSARHTHALEKSSVRNGSQMPQDPDFDPNNVTSLPEASQTDPAPGPNNRPKPDQMLRPPDPTRRFTDFTPEQRVEFARKGHGPGG